MAWIRRLRELASLLCVLVAAAMLVGAAQAEEQACRWLEWGPGYFKVRQSGEEWTYALAVAGPKWRHTPYGRHGPGHLSCPTCPTDPPEPGGVYGFIAQEHVNKNGAAFVMTAAERAERRVEGVAYPLFSLNPESLVHLGSRENLRLGPLTGYAVLYRVVTRKEGEPRTLADILGQADRGLVVLALWDGCVWLELSFFIGRLGDSANAWAALDALLEEATLTKVRGGSPPVWPRRSPAEPNLYGAIVRNAEPAAQ
jgi:hypothetical protein